MYLCGVCLFFNYGEFATFNCKTCHNHYIYSVFSFLLAMKNSFILAKKAFTLMEILIVIVIIGILLAVTMRFWSGRINDLKAQSYKEQFVSYYNELYSQNMTSSFRDATKYKQLNILFSSGISYQLDGVRPASASDFSSLLFRDFLLDSWAASSVQLQFVPYELWCGISSPTATGAVVSFHAYMPENGKQYCFEIASETCKLIEKRCEDIK